MSRLALCLAVLLAGWNLGCAAARAQQPGSARATPARIVGGPGGGCIAGAVELPAAGPGYQTIRTGTDMGGAILLRVPRVLQVGV